MIFELVKELVELLLLATASYWGLVIYVHSYHPKWSLLLEIRSLATLLALMLAISIIKVSEDVLGGEFNAIDTAILIFIHHYVSNSFNDFFEVVTLTGSLWFMLSITTVMTVVLLSTRHFLEAKLIIVSAISSTITIYIIKLFIARPRPALWDVTWYWGSSFPSGHTLSVAAFATASLLCARRIYPNAHNTELGIAIIWIVLVATSRLVLGVHWPTDVFVAVCIGALLPIMISVFLDLQQRSR